MSFRQSAESIARINSTLNSKHIGGEQIQVSFRSDPDVIASVLPAPLKPSGTDKVTAKISRWVSNYCGAFTMAGLYVEADHEGMRGEYILSMFIDTFDAALLIGREGFGEPKKMASVDLFRFRNSFVGTVDRMGTRLMTLEVDAGEDDGPSQGQAVLFSVKATLALGGGLLGDALLFAQDVAGRSSENRRGSGQVTLGGTPHDPLDEFPVLEVIGASYSLPEAVPGPTESDECLRATIPAEEFLPYHYGRLDDWSAHNALGALAR